MRKGIIKKVEIIHNPCYHPDMTTVYVLVNIFVNFFLPFVSSPHYFVTHLHAYWQYPLINVASSDVSPKCHSNVLQASQSQYHFETSFWRTVSS